MNVCVSDERKTKQESDERNVTDERSQRKSDKRRRVTEEE